MNVIGFARERNGYSTPPLVTANITECVRQRWNAGQRDVCASEMLMEE